MQKAIISLFWFLFSTGDLIAQNYTPITVSGFNVDGVAETFPNSFACTSQALDPPGNIGGNHVLYSAAYAAAASFGGGLPNSGAIVNGNETYQLMPYTVNNMLHVTTASTNTLTLASPASYSALHFLVFSTEGSSTFNLTIHYTDLTSSPPVSFTVQDWFNGSNAVLTGMGRCKRVTTNPTADGPPSNPRLYELNMAPSCADQQKQIAAIVVTGILSNSGGGGGYILAVSGTTINAAPSISYSHPLCQGGPNATPTLIGTTGGAYTSSPAGLSLDGSSGVINLAGSTPGTYTVAYTTADACPQSASYTLSVLPAPNITVNSPTVCAGQTATLMASGATSYTWVGNSLSSVTGPLVNATVSSTGVYTLTGTSNGCSSTVTSTITVQPLPVMTVNSAVICPGEQAALSSTVSIAGGNYTWLPGNQTTPSITISPSASASYTVTYVLNGCSALAVATVSLKPLPGLSVSSGSVCLGDTLTITAQASTTGGNYLWQPNGETTASISKSPTATSGYTVSYTLNGCTVSASALVGVFPKPIVNISASASQVTPGDEVSVTASGGGGYLWSNGAVTSQILVKPLETTAYCATVTSSAGCKSKDCIEVLVNPESTLYIPNAFTPNGDGINDLFYITGYNLSHFDLNIYNRWGQLLFHTTEPMKAWDGSFNGEIVSGVYVFVLRAKGNDGSDYNKTGHITLIR